jgi:hypothetical protein
MIEEAEGKTK